ncbi:hypothetical protein [Actinomadura sp. KC06]|uniref:hypothetical protein n=1 Tax=Actinomadura sp. KC06 TaxID=2530369 RepID=UPI001A9E3B11|nr:hypothetical protein [Actinomadura sp. KC06]
MATGWLIDKAAADGLCIDQNDTAVAPPCEDGARPAADTRTDRAFYDRVMRAWSMKGFTAKTEESGHDHFFAAFAKFGAATGQKGAMLAAVASEAAKQNVSYLEPLISRQSGAMKDLASDLGWTEDLPAMAAKITGAPGFDRIVEKAAAETDADIAEMRRLLGCGADRPDPGCRMAVRIDHQVNRIGEPSVVFANLVLGAVLAERDPNVVGMNLVAPEDEPKAIKEYSRQMRMVGYLRRTHPAAHVTLHAGELTPRFAGPDALKSHIQEAVTVARAERIGHGVDIAGETGSAETLKTMADRHILVEINLTSNCQILRVCGARHPFTLYRAHNVPVTLSTDDQGIEHTDLTHEYLRALRDFHLTYSDLKTLARASLEHAFIQGRSLWRSRDVHQLDEACHQSEIEESQPGPACASLLRSSPKAQLQWRQEIAFHHFEQRYGASGPAR